MPKPIRVIEYANLVYPPEKHYIELIGFTVSGNLPRKSNQRRIVKVRGKPMVIKSRKALDFEKSFLDQVPVEARILAGDANHPLALWAHVYYQSNRSDLSVELLKDLLQKAAVITDDRWIKAEFLFGSIDRDCPRIHLALYAIG